jgi:hypothetical protein
MKFWETFSVIAMIQNIVITIFTILIFKATITYKLSLRRTQLLSADFLKIKFSLYFVCLLSKNWAFWNTSCSLKNTFSSLSGSICTEQILKTDFLIVSLSVFQRTYIHLNLLEQLRLILRQDNCLKNRFYFGHFHICLKSMSPFFGWL